ncbi:MAG: glycosyltransferase, partial [Nanoarchaeota archaeon]
QPFITITSEMITWFEQRFKCKPHMKVGEQVFEFDRARNFNFSQVPKEYGWILWLDCDDVFRKGENIHKLIELATQQKSDAIYLNYLYQVEINERGEITKIVTQNPRERIIRNTQEFQWRGIIHEILTKEVIYNPITNEDCDTVHLVDHEDRIASLWRNISACEATLAKTKVEDPRFIYYLAKLLSDLRIKETDKDAQTLMFEYLLGPAKSQWEEERGQVWGYIADIYNRNGEHSNAINALMNGLMEYPESRSLFINIALSYTMMGNWKKALFWLSLIEKVPQKKSLLATSPYDELIRILEIKYDCYYNLGKFAEVRKIVKEIEQYVSKSILRENSLGKVEELLKKRKVIL